MFLRGSLHHFKPPLFLSVCWLLCYYSVPDKFWKVPYCVKSTFNLCLSVC